jgi:CheY-like chemotaxis protein
MTNFSRILLVEDDPADARLAMAVFKDLGLSDQVITVADGMEALDFLQLHGRFSDRAPGHPAVTLLDLKLPRLNGLELLQKVRKNPALKQIPIVCLTSSREDRDVRRAYELGTNAYVVKTINYDEYAAALKALASFWAVANEAPPGCLPRPVLRGSHEKVE